MPTYDPAPPECSALVTDIIAKHYPDLVEAGVTINCMAAFADLNKFGESKGSALKLHGYPCKAIIKINSYKDRREGKSDATLTVDGDKWDNWSEKEKTAAVHHEVHHLLVIREKKSGAIKLDKADRPKLKNRLHDLVVGGFTVIAELYGEYAGEFQQIQSVKDRFGQLLWDFAEPDTGKSRRRGRKAQVASQVTHAATGEPVGEPDAEPAVIHDFTTGENITATEMVERIKDGFAAGNWGADDHVEEEFDEFDNHDSDDGETDDGETVGYAVDPETVDVA